jgi:pyruvate formate lyase activating enzyme
MPTVMVSNGYITYEAFHDIYDHVDAANIDLKAFTEEFLRPHHPHAPEASPRNAGLAEKRNQRVVRDHQPDHSHPQRRPRKFRQIADWILENLGPDVPLHFTAFHPDFKLMDKPRTPPETLHRARAIAREAGLHYVYEGNILNGAGNTVCPKCSKVLIRRGWHEVQSNALRAGACPDCGHPIPGRWSHPSAPPPRTNAPAPPPTNKYDHWNL